MSKALRTVLCGAGGYGRQYLDAILQDGAFELTGVVQTNMHRHTELAVHMAQLGVPVYDTLEAFFDHHRADVAIITTPISRHYDQCVTALKSGAHVLCEKPLVSDYAKAMALERLALDEGVQLQLGVGYQRSYSPSMLALKQDVLNGRFGKPLRMATASFMPRSDAYFRRSAWAGRVLDDTGAPILDSVLHNAAAHQLHAMLYLLGPEMDASAQILSVRAECTRAHRIDSFDACAVSIETRECPQVFFAGTHACTGDARQLIRFEWERGCLDMDLACRGNLIVRTPEGDVDYGTSSCEVPVKLRTFAQRLLNNEPLPCTPTAAKAEVAVAVGVFLSADVRNVEGIAQEGPEGIYLNVPGQDEVLMKAYEAARLPCDMGLTFGNAPRRVAMAEIIRAFF